jgi:hypothetical protein
MDLVDDAARSGLVTALEDDLEGGPRRKTEIPMPRTRVRWSPQRGRPRMRESAASGSRRTWRNEGRTSLVHHDALPPQQQTTARPSSAPLEADKGADAAGRSGLVLVVRARSLRWGRRDERLGRTGVASFRRARPSRRPRRRSGTKASETSNATSGRIPGRVFSRRVGRATVRHLGDVHRGGHLLALR